jgi:hypothetical protein
MTANNPSALDAMNISPIKGDNAKTLLNSWLTKAAKKKGLLSTVSILPLAACGGGNSSTSALTVAEAIGQFADLVTNEYHVEDTAENIAAALNNDSAEPALVNAAQVSLPNAEPISVADANLLATLSNFVGHEGAVTLSDFGSVTAGEGVDQYTLADGGPNDLTVSPGNLDVNVIGGVANDTINIGGLVVTGTYNLGAGDNVIEIADNGDISGATASAEGGTVNLQLVSGATGTMTAEQHNSAASIAGAGVGGAGETIQISNVGILEGDADIETYRIQAGSEFTPGAAGQNVTETQTDTQDAVSTLIFGANAYTGSFSGFGATDVIKVVDGTDISGAAGLDVGVVDFGDSDATLTLDAAQNASLTILAAGADDGLQTITVDEVATFTGDVNIETYNITEGSEFTLGTLSQNASEVGGSGTVSTLVFGAGAYTGDLTGFDAQDILEVVDGTDLSGNSIAQGVLDFGDANASVTLTVAQHAGMTVQAGGADSGQQAIVLVDGGTVLAKSGIEKYTLSNDGNSTFTQSAGSTDLEVVSGASDDLIISDDNDSFRDNLTVDFASGGNDTIRLLNDTGSVDGNGLVSSDFGGFGGSGNSVSGGNSNHNEDTRLLTGAEWDGSAGSTGADVIGFTASATHTDRDMIQLSEFTGGVLEGVNRTTTDISGIASGSVLEINTASFTVSGDQFGALGSVATMLDSLSNVADGDYYIVAYNGSDTNADAGLYYARATEGDGFDFADTNGATGGYDTDSLELLAVFHEVGANELSSLNFEAVV